MLIVGGAAIELQLSLSKRGAELAGGQPYLGRGVGIELDARHSNMRTVVRTKRNVNP